jgi:type IV pilus assembly protein PilB
VTISLSESEQRLGRALVESRLVTPEQLESAVGEKRKRGLGKSLGQLLVELGHLKEEALVGTLGSLYNLPVMSAADIAPSPEVLGTIPEEMIRKYKVFPVFCVGDELTVAVTDPAEFHVLDLLRERTRLSIQPVVIGNADLVRLIDEQLGAGRRAPRAVAVGLDEKPAADGAVADIRDLERAGRALPVIEIVDKIFAKAVLENASDIHLEPTEGGLRVRFRIDGQLSEQLVLAPHLMPGVASRIKIISGLDISERQVPQDGRIRARILEREIDMRVSTLPTSFGEKVVLRLLDRERSVVPLEQLGLSRHNREIFERLTRESYGLLLVTGPTGSGKTTTLYSALATLDTVKYNIITVEDPVEYQLPRINQVPINAKRGLTFALALRAILRQDPDVILVGEIRDPETGNIAAEAALTGHLVFSTLHTNDAVSTIHRLVEIGVEPYLISPTLLGVIAQRLVRTICPHCRQQYPPTPAEVRALGLEAVPAGLLFSRGAGCARCSMRGYKGRTGVHEILLVDERIRALISERAPAGTIREYLRERGFQDMRYDGLRKIAAGITTVEEVLRATRDLT